MSRSRRLAALVAVAALSLAGCSRNDAKRSDVVDAMKDAGLTDEQAECVGDRFEEEFDQDTLNELGGANDPEDFPEGTEDQVNAILDECLGGGPTTTGETGGEGGTTDGTGETGGTGDTTGTTAGTTTTAG
ncbi:MAG TPA: hypothetical protein VF743_06705 [Acidimicrobiales bacterium]